MKHDVRFDQNIKSCLATCDLLRLILRNPGQFASSEVILNSLKSQGALAKLELIYDETGVMITKVSMSLNTLKAHAEIHLPGGFNELNSLRLAALKSIQDLDAKKQSPSTKRTKSGLTRIVTELEEELEKQQRANMILLQGLNLALNELRNIRSSLAPALLEKRANDAAQALTALLGMNPSFPDQNASSNTQGHATRFEDYRK